MVFGKPKHEKITTVTTTTTTDEVVDDQSQPQVAPPGAVTSVGETISPAPASMQHDIKITDLNNHPVFRCKVSCTCGTTLYAKDIAQAEGHRKFHQDQVKRREVLGGK